MNPTPNLDNHYAAAGLRDRLEEGLAAAGLANGPIDWMQLIQLDQFHTRGLLAVKELAELLDPQEGESVLDLGSGFGGPARYLAATRKCDVMGIDLTQLYVEIANELTDRCGLEDHAVFVQGNAADLPFDSSSFDRAWTIHVSMNIEDKRAFYEGVYRVLKPGGMFALYDVAKGEGGPVIYPAPWSPVEEYSFLSTPSETQSQLRAAGFSTIKFEDASAEAIEWLKQIQAAGTPDPTAPKTVDLRDVIGSQIRPMLRNMNQNFLEGRVKIVRALVQKPG